MTKEKSSSMLIIIIKKITVTHIYMHTLLTEVCVWGGGGEGYFKCTGVTK